MASINLRSMHPLLRPISNLPEFLHGEEIIVISGGLDVLKGVALSMEEGDRADEISFPEARARFMAARRIVRFALSKWRAADPSELEIIPDENGKPFLVANDPIHFSITHSSDHIAVAFSRNRIGLDLEQVREVDGASLASRFLSPEEAARVAQSEDPNLFFKLWTCREAAIKADGRGLSKLLAITSVTEAGRGNADPLEVKIGDDRWEALHWNSGAIHGALAFQRMPSLISWYDLS